MELKQNYVPGTEPPAAETTEASAARARRSRVEMLADELMELKVREFRELAELMTSDGRAPAGMLMHDALSRAGAAWLMDGGP